MADRRFVLVHSPFVGPATWRWVADSMRAAGHPVLVPSMVGFEVSGTPGCCHRGRSGGATAPWSHWSPMPGVASCSRRSCRGSPFAYLEQMVPIDPDWSVAVDPSFLWFSDVYEADAVDPAGRGWPVHRIPGGHLHMAVDPDAVAAALITLAT